MCLKGTSVPFLFEGSGMITESHLGAQIVFGV